MVFRPCSVAGCPNLSVSGKCDEHRNSYRGKTAERGYDGAWQKLRLYKLQQDPICEMKTHCNGAAAVEVHHRIPIRFRPDLRLVMSNLQSACKPCHASLKSDK